MLSIFNFTLKPNCLLIFLWKFQYVNVPYILWLMWQSQQEMSTYVINGNDSLTNQTGNTFCKSYCADNIIILSLSSSLIC